jgi:glycosyltransferase involved in cell wall biosynthesis
MLQVLHIVDRHTPLDAVHQLNLLRRPGQTVLSFGRPPWPEILTAKAKVEHVGLGLVHLTAQRIRKRLGRFDILHCWSIRSLGPAAALAGLLRTGLVLCLSRVPQQQRHLSEIRKVLAESPLRITLPARTSRKSIVALLAGEDADLQEKILSRIDVLAPPAQPCLSHEARVEAREHLGIDPDHYVLVAPGEALPEARHERVAWAQGIVSRLDLPIHLLLCDPGRCLCLTLGRKKMTGTPYPPRYIRSLNRNEVLAAADLAVFAQARPVGTQAFAACLGAGVASLSAPTADAVEIFGPPGCAAGYLQSAHPRDLARDILQLLEDPDRRNLLCAQAARRFGARHTPAQVRTCLAKIYRDAQDTASLAASALQRL